MKNSINLLSDIIFYMKYSKYLPELKRRETWKETVNRNMQMHISKFPHIKELIEKTYKLVEDKKILPSMRSMQFGGIPILKNNCKLYNCSGIGIDSIDSFADLFYLLLCGCGVGFSVRENFISKLPNFAEKTNITYTFTIEDSIEGWADSIKELMKSFFISGNEVIFNYSLIRPAGSLISSSGSIAPGPESLKQSINLIKEIYNNAILSKKTFSSIDCFDICCLLASAVLSGGIRRSACICLFDKNDNEMLNAKTGNWWENTPWRSNCNISVQMNRDDTTYEEFMNIFNITKQSSYGEPGFTWTNNNEWLNNPCAEISFSNNSFCNLTEINGEGLESQDDLNNRAYYATILGTLQAAYIDFPYINKKWKDNAEMSALLGVSITGLASIDMNKFSLKEAAKYVDKANKYASYLLGINNADRLTSIKPSGTSAKILGTSSGIHPWYAPYYWQRIRINKLEPIYKYLIDNVPELIEDDKIKSTDAVLKICIKAPENSITRNDETAIDFLNRVKYVFENWIKSGHIIGDNYNNVSCTCSVKSNEWDEVSKWMWENRYNYTGISLLAYSNNAYEQAPWEECTEEDYINFNEKEYKINLESIIENRNYVNFNLEVACAGGNCEII